MPLLEPSAEYVLSTNRWSRPDLDPVSTTAFSGGAVGHVSRARPAAGDTAGG